MKDDHQADHLEVAMQTPEGTFYKVIPSAFLWTVYQRPYGRLTTVLSVFPSCKKLQGVRLASEGDTLCSLNLSAVG